VTGALELPIVEVIRPGAAAAAQATRNRKIGVIGTTATIASGVYEGVFNAIDPSIEVFAKACPLFVPIAEEGPYWWRHESTRIIAGEYLAGLLDTGIDSLLLGCTHYPLLESVICDVIGGGISIVSSAGAVATEVYDRLDALGIRLDSASGACPRVNFYTSDSPDKFEPLCNAILGGRGGLRIEKLDIEKYESRLP
jgi:glutamate racemase